MKKIFVIWFIIYKDVFCEIRSSHLFNKIKNSKLRRVGDNPTKLVPLTEIPVPLQPSGRRHMEDCRYVPGPNTEIQGPNINIEGDYYDDKLEKKMVTIRMPDHIDRKHFEVTTPVPYFTVGEIEAIGFNPSTKTANECEQIYMDHIADQYTDEWTDQSEESMEMAKMPINAGAILAEEYRPGRMYDDYLN